MKQILYTIFSAVLVLYACKQETKVTEIFIEPQTLQLVAGESHQLELVVSPEDAVPEQSVWQSSNPSVAAVNSEGRVTAVSAGQTSIKVTCGTLSSICEVTVSDSETESVTLDRHEASVFVGEELQLNVTVVPYDGEVVFWTSSDESVAEVDMFGLVKTLSVGNAVITASCGGLEDACELTVNPIASTSVTVDPSELTLGVGEQRSLSATVYPENATDKSVVWDSSDESVVVVDGSGIVTAVAAGAAVVSARNGDNTGICEVTVENVRDMQIGDYYFSDGTVSGILEEGKTPIGVVFWLGNPAEEDEVLAKEHPECVNGLVVALSGSDYQAWQSNHSAYGQTVGSWVENNLPEYKTVTSDKTGEAPDLLNKKLGYNNTKAIEAFNAASENAEWQVEAVNYVVSYRGSVPAPENTSGWYLPSAKELHLLISGEVDGNIWSNMAGTAIEDIVNERMEAVGTADRISSYLWSSTERSATSAYLIWNDVSGIASFPAKDNADRMKVRPVLAF